MDESSISKRIIALIIKHIDSQKSDRSAAKKAKISNTSIDLYRAGSSMKLDTMEKILEAFPELKTPIAEILLGERIKKHTAATKADEAAVNREREELLKDLDAFRSLAIHNAQTILNLSAGGGTKAPQEA